MPWDVHRFLDFDYPPHLQPAGEYPTGSEVLAYLNAYAAHFQLDAVIHRGCRLMKMKQAAKGDWRGVRAVGNVGAHYGQAACATMGCMGTWVHTTASVWHHAEMHDYKGFVLLRYTVPGIWYRYTVPV